MYGPRAPFQAQPNLNPLSPESPMLTRFSLFALCLASAVGCTASIATSGGWESDLRHELPRMGHRNFVVVADSAYPLQSAPGIKTIHVGGTQAQVLKKVLTLLAEQKHVRPVAWVDSEQAQVPEADAPGIMQCRKDLAAALAGTTVQTAAHMDIIKKLDESSKLFNVILIKTDEVLPYTSVFLELDCGYWNSEKEARLRAAMK